MSFDPKDHLTKMGTRDYLETKWRIAWFRDEHPNGKIATRVLQSDPPLVKATIFDNDGAFMASAHGTAKTKQGAVWAGREIEKAETAAIGRALGHAGYGTQFTDEDEGDHLSDSPVERAQAPQNGKQAQRPPQPPPAQSSPVAGGNSRPLASDGSTPSLPSSAGASSSAPAGGKGDTFGKQFPPRVVVTSTALWDAMHDFFDNPHHFEAHWQKHASTYADKTLEEASAWLRDYHWNYDEALRKKLMAYAQANFRMSQDDVMHALSAAAGHAVNRVRQWDAGNYTVAHGALLAWAGEYKDDRIMEIAATCAAAPTVLDVALTIANDKRKQVEIEMARNHE